MRTTESDRALIPRPDLVVVISSTPSDSHTWNLTFLELLLGELGCQVTNLGPCVPAEVLLDACREVLPDLVVMSSVNGHGFADAMRMIGRLRACEELACARIVIGGKLGIVGGVEEYSSQLVLAGFDAVFDDTHDTSLFAGFVGALPAGVTRGN